MNLLEARGVCKAFGKLQALLDVNLKVDRGLLQSVIGPNGAGKTTLFNVISGRLRPERGEVIFNGETITWLPPHAIVQKGLSRSFQITNIFPELTVLENVCIGLTVSHGKAFDAFHPLRSSHAMIEEAETLIESVGLVNYRDRKASVLSHGDRKLLEFSLVLTLNPVLMLLDEPTAGMNQEETNNTVRLIRKISEEKGITVILTEHDIDLVFSISDRIAVLNQGRMIAEGTPEEIRANPMVRQAYLGED